MVQFQNEYMKFLFLFAVCLLLNNAISLATPDTQINSHSLGTISRPEEQEPFYHPKEENSKQVVYLKGEIVGERMILNNEVIGYKWPLQYENRDPMDDYHIYFFVGGPVDINANQWLDSNLDFIMTKFKQSKGMEYLKVSFPSFYLSDTQLNDGKQVPCIDEYKATKQGYSFETYYKLNRPFLFAFIRKEDNKVMFKKYIQNPLLEGQRCPFPTYLVSSNTIPIQSDDGYIPNILHQEKEGADFFRGNFIFNAIITPSTPSETSFLSEPPLMPYVTFKIKGKFTYLHEATIISIYAKTHPQAKTNRFVIFFVYPQHEAIWTFPFPEEHFADIFEKTRFEVGSQMHLIVPSFIAKMKSKQQGSYSVCINETNGVSEHGFDWDEHQQIRVFKFSRPFQIFVHDLVTNKAIASGVFFDYYNQSCAKL